MNGRNAYAGGGGDGGVSGSAGAGGTAHSQVVPLDLRQDGKEIPWDAGSAVSQAAHGSSRGRRRGDAKRPGAGEARAGRSRRQGHDAVPRPAQRRGRRRDETRRRGGGAGDGGTGTGGERAHRGMRARARPTPARSPPCVPRPGAWRRRSGPCAPASRARGVSIRAAHSVLPRLRRVPEPQKRGRRREGERGRGSAPLTSEGPLVAMD